MPAIAPKKFADPSGDLAAAARQCLDRIQAADATKAKIVEILLTDPNFVASVSARPAASLQTFAERPVGTTGRMSAARRAELLALTPDGRAILARERKGKA